MIVYGDVDLICQVTKIDFVLKIFGKHLVIVYVY